MKKAAIVDHVTFFPVLPFHLTPTLDLAIAANAPSNPAAPPISRFMPT
jgi:hypothetical protein